MVKCSALEKIKEENPQFVTNLVKFLSFPNILMNQEEISCYDLFQIMNVELEDLRRVYKGKELINEINSITIPKKEQNPDKPFLCTNILFNINLRNTVITISFEPNHCIRVVKDLETGAIYYGKSNSHFADYLQDGFIENHFDRLEDYFTTIERYKKTFNTKWFGYSLVEEKFSNSLFKISLFCSCYGNCSVYIYYGSGMMAYWGIEERIEKFINDDLELKDEILQKVPVKIDELNPTLKKIVEYYQNCNSLPRLVKKNNNVPCRKKNNFI